MRRTRPQTVPSNNRSERRPAKPKPVRRKPSQAKKQAEDPLEMDDALEAPAHSVDVTLDADTEAPSQRTRPSSDSGSGSPKPPKWSPNTRKIPVDRARRKERQDPSMPSSSDSNSGAKTKKKSSTESSKKKKIVPRRSGSAVVQSSADRRATNKSKNKSKGKSKSKAVVNVSITQEESCIRSDLNSFSSQNDTFVVRGIRRAVLQAVRTNLAEYLQNYALAKRILPNASECTAWAEHMTKNRYNDIMCLDSSRVTLRVPKGTTETYINASVVTGRRLNNKFILTQGPLLNTIYDFWRMVWQERCPLILMLCDSIENSKRKCSEYYPSREGAQMTLNGIHVECLGHTVHSTQNLTETYLRLLYDGVSFDIVHWKWTGWPDHEVPHEDLQVPFRLLTMVRIASGPSVVHCSAGVGRSGSLVALECCLTDLADGIDLNVREIVEFVRKQRAHSVQTPKQFLFIYRAIIEFAVSSEFVTVKEVQPFLDMYDRYVNTSL